MADHERESDCNGSQLISCITAVIFTLFITSSMCSVRFKLFKSVIWQNYEVNTHTLTPGVQSVTLLSPPFTWPRVPHKILAIVFCDGHPRFSVATRATQPGSHVNGGCQHLREERQQMKEAILQKKKKKRVRKALIVSLVYMTQWHPKIYLVLSLQVNQHSLLIRWHTLTHHAWTSGPGCFLSSFAWRLLHEDRVCVFRTDCSILSTDWINKNE